MKQANKNRLRLNKDLIMVTALGIILTASVIHSPINSLQADSINPGTYSVDEKPFGKTYSEWTENFWKWMISIPQQNNPNLDPTGERCGINQTDANVWYLAPTFGGAAERTCEIPAGKAILFPLLVTECNYLENPELKTETDLQFCARQGNDLGSRTMEVIVDGTKLRDLEAYRVESQPFKITFPENNVYSVSPGTTEAISDGFWVFLKPMPAGSHNIDFGASLIDPSGVGNYNTHVKYHLIIGASTNPTTQGQP